MSRFDKSSKWLIQHFGGSILGLAGVRDNATGDSDGPIP
jgi:hypothetical protein